MMEKLEQRRIIKKKKPRFIRQDAHKKKRLTAKWIKPRGLQSKLRLNKRGHRKKVSPGYGSPREVRGTDKSGNEMVIVNNTKLEEIDPKSQAIIISGTVGLKKRMEILKLAKEKGISVINVKDIDSFMKEAEDRLKERKEAKDKKRKKREEGEKKRKAEGEKKDKGIEKTVSEEEKKEQEKKEKEEQKKEKDRVLTQRT